MFSVFFIYLLKTAGYNGRVLNAVWFLPASADF